MQPLDCGAQGLDKRKASSLRLDKVHTASLSGAVFNSSERRYTLRVFAVLPVAFYNKLPPI